MAKFGINDILNAKTKAAGQQVSESDTEENGMNPPEARAGDDYETPHPEGITSICYSCTEYETCNVKTGTCTSCDQYKNRTEAYKTDEQRYSEEQDAIDRETKKKLREQGYFKEHPEMDFEEGIKQLRQKGTEMGGRADELTGEDFHGEEVELKDGTRTDTLEAARKKGAASKKTAPKAAPKAAPKQAAQGAADRTPAGQSGDAKGPRRHRRNAPKREGQAQSAHAPQPQNGGGQASENREPGRRRPHRRRRSDRKSEGQRS